MATFEIMPGRKIGQEEPCFVIAEIGQNHQGDLNIAKELIAIAKECGADCVKFQKSDLKSRFNKKALERPYISPNSWGVTYGEHRKRLEFSKEQFLELKDYASSLNIPFVASGMDKVSVDFLNDIGVPFFKIGSGDANNYPLLNYTASLGKPLIVSTGMQELATVRGIYERVLPINKRLCILQCTSSYPAPPHDINLNVIKTYEKEFPEAVIGYSGHERGIGISVTAVAFGAKVVERHLTIDHLWQGTDHAASLEPHEFKQLVKEVKVIRQALGSFEKTKQPSENACFAKLAKSVVATQYLTYGTYLEEDMLAVKVAEPKGWKAEKMHELIGRRLRNDVDEDCSIREEDLL